MSETTLVQIFGETVMREFATVSSGMQAAEVGVLQAVTPTLLQAVTPTLFEDVTLGVHIVAGFVALFAGLGAIVTKKGGRRHRRAGRFYVRGMAIVAVTALVLFALTPNLARTFLALVAVFSYYFVFSGDRVLSRKRPVDSPKTADWIAVGLLIVAGIGLLVMGVVFSLDGSQFGVVMLVFGGLGTFFGAQDVQRFRRGDGEPREWFYEHISRMGGAYIATVTAFSSVNFTFLPTVAAWLWPTLVGAPLIAYTVRKYKQQAAQPRAVAAD